MPLIYLNCQIVNVLIVFWFRYRIAGLESVDPNFKRVKLNSLDGYSVAGKTVVNRLLIVKPQWKRIDLYLLFIRIKNRLLL